MALREPQLHKWKLAQRSEEVSSSISSLLPQAPPGPPGVLDPIPLLHPFGRTEFAYLYEQLSDLDVAVGLPTAGGTMSGTIVLATEPSAALSFQGRYSLTSDNAGTPGHTASGPNLVLRDLAVSENRLLMRSIGQLSVHLRDASLATNGVSHALQIHHKSTGAAQTAAGFGTGVQAFATDVTDVEREFGNLQFFWMNPTTLSSAFALRVMTTGVNSVVLQSIPGGHLLATNKLLATGGLGSAGSIAATTLTAPGTVSRRLPIYDEAGALLGSVPIYPAGSFS